MSRSELEFIEVEPKDENVLDLSLLSSELIELKELMNYTAHMVNESTEPLIRIRANVEAAHQEVVIGEQELKGATQEKTTNRKTIGKIVVSSTLILL